MYESPNNQNIHSSGISMNIIFIFSLVLPRCFTHILTSTCEGNGQWYHRSPAHCTHVVNYSNLSLYLYSSSKIPIFVVISRLCSHVSM